MKHQKTINDYDLNLAIKIRLGQIIDNAYQYYIELLFCCFHFLVIVFVDCNYWAISLELSKEV